MFKKVILVVAGTFAFGTLASAHSSDQGHDNHYYRDDAHANIQKDRYRLQRDLARRDRERRELQVALHHGDTRRIHAERHQLDHAEARVRQDLAHLRQERGFHRARH